MNSLDDTIAAIATAPGEAGISIVRVSGPAALVIADRVFKCSGPVPSFRAASSFVIGRVRDSDGSPIDEVLLLIMRAPHSYTGDDTVEFQGHGGSVNARRILRRVMEAGARAAEPGEFTKRAFLNGRIDLLQAEAVLDLIKAKSERAAVAAVQQLGGDLSKRLNAIYDAILGIVSDLEATLDFSEDEIPASVLDGISLRLKGVQRSIDSMLATWEEGHVLREGASIVISGRPNAGKSTLLNALLGRDRAIVSDQPGTTRDVIEESITIYGITAKLIDTAGLRHADCAIEREGVRRTKSEVEKADLHVYVIDATCGATEEDMINLSSMNQERCIVVFNKVDLPQHIGTELSLACTSTCVSSLTRQGIDDLRKLIGSKLDGGISSAGCQMAVISERHREHLALAGSRVCNALSLLDGAGQESSDLAATELRSALESLGLVTGRAYYDELLNSIFSRFCIGK